MNRTRRQLHAVMQLSFALAALIFLSGLTYAQDASTAIPDNATALKYGKGWRCNIDYREANGRCAQVVVPMNAFPTNTNFGRGWECAHGYALTEEIFDEPACVAVPVPANAHLDSIGDRWRCDRQYRLVDDRCLAIEVPLHGYLDRSGDKWQCDRGYRATDETCIAVVVPTNAYLTDSTYGTGWACERGYRAIGETCALVRVPLNAYFVETSYGRGWSCERGFLASDDACVAIDLPENAHLDYSGSDWDCNRPYHKVQMNCALARNDP